MDFISAIIVALVEGITEFLPVSSTGHLIIVGDILGFNGAKEKSFDIIIQLGAILSVVVIYWQRFWGLTKTNPLKRFSGARGLYLLALTSAPAAIVGFFGHKLIREKLFGSLTVAMALLVGAVIMLLVEARGKRERYFDLDEVTPKLALGIGLFQCLSLWPGFSRSGATIIGAMLLGAKRKLAAEYSFFAAVPIMCMATGYEFLKSYQEFDADDLGVLIVGFVVSFASAFAAVKWFIHLVSTVSLRPFAYYRIVIATIVGMWWVFQP